MDWETKRVFADWDNDVNAEMRRLIKNGVPPYDAVDRARENVSRRRQENGDTVKVKNQPPDLTAGEFNRGE